MSRALAALLFLFFAGLSSNAAMASPSDIPGWTIRVLFVSLAIAALVATLVHPSVRARIAAATIASLLGLFAIETYEWRFGLFMPTDYPEGYDPRSKFELVVDMRKQGIEAYPTLHPAAYIAPKKVAGVVTMPFGGVANAVTVYCKENESGQFLVFESDEQGFNNPPGIWQRTSLDMALIGDSFTQGACVLEGNFAEYLRRRFDGVLNLGSGNNGPLIELATIKEYLAEFRPGIVLWFYYEGNDMANLRSERQSAMLMRYLSSDFRQDLRTRLPEIDAEVRSFVNQSIAQLSAAQSRGVVHEESYGLFDFARLALFQKHLRHLSLPAQPVATGGLGLFERILREARETVETWDGKLYFVYLPAYEWVRRGETEPRRKEVLDAARVLDIPIVDIDALFRARPEPLALFPFNQDGVHYTQEGNRLIAEALIRAIDSPHNEN